MKMGTYWRFAAIVGGLWLALGVGLGLVHMPWPNLDDLRAQRVAEYCTILPFGSRVALTERFSEPQLHAMASDPEGLRPVIVEASTNRGASLPRDLKKLASPSTFASYSADDQARQFQIWTPWLQRCVKKLDADYRAVRRHEAALYLAPRVSKIIGVPVWLLLLGICLSVYRLIVRPEEG